MDSSKRFAAASRMACQKRVVASLGLSSIARRNTRADSSKSQLQSMAYARAVCASARRASSARARSSFGLRTLERFARSLLADGDHAEQDVTACHARMGQGIGRVGTAGGFEQFDAREGAMLACASPIDSAP